jgi:hypothetical protein
MGDLGPIIDGRGGEVNEQTLPVSGPALPDFFDFLFQSVFSNLGGGAMF